MRRIATLVATGAVAAAAAISLAAGPASADSGVRAGSLHSSITASAITTKPWYTSGSSGVAGVSASGRVGWVTKGKTVYLSGTIKDTKADGLRAGLEVYVPGYAPTVFVGKGSTTLSAKAVSVREVLGHLKGSKFYIVRHAKSYKRII